MKKFFAAGSNSSSSVIKYAENLGAEVCGILDDEYGMIGKSTVGNDALTIEVYAEPEDDFSFYNYVQPLDEIDPKSEDLDSDATEVAEAVMNGLYDQEKSNQIEDRTTEPGDDDYISMNDEDEDAGWEE